MSKRNEIECLEKVKEAYKAKKIVFDNSSNCIIENILKSAKENPNQNDFPDFVFDGGGIEHFAVWSSKENSKGSSFIKEQKKNDKEASRYINENINNAPHDNNVVASIAVNNVYSDFSYDYFFQSFVKNVSKHLESLHKKGFENKTVIFLIEQPTARMVIYRDKFTAKFYEFSKDKKILSWIKENCLYVNYFIYCVCDGIEIIDLAKIDTLISHSIDYDGVEGGTLNDVKLNLIIDLDEYFAKNKY